MGIVTLPFDVPVDPDRPEARRLLEEELGKQRYQEAKPTWWDQFIQNLINSLFNTQGGGQPQAGSPNLALLVAGLVLLGILIVAFLVFGLPRINRRSRITGALFGEDDPRTSVQQRVAAEAAASRGDFALAIAEMYRSIARGLAERTIVTTSPGTTAHDFANRAGVAFPGSAEQLTLASIAFDEVRYLGRSGTAAQYSNVAALERTLRTARPAAFEVVDA